MDTLREEYRGLPSLVEIFSELMEERDLKAAARDIVAANGARSQP
jgi:hypothetical protein